MSSRILDNIKAFTQNPQDLLTPQELVAFLESDLGMDQDTSWQLVQWLISEGYLELSNSSYYGGEDQDMVCTAYLRHGPRFSEQDSRL